MPRQIQVTLADEDYSKLKGWADSSDSTVYSVLRDLLLWGLDNPRVKSRFKVGDTVTACLAGEWHYGETGSVHRIDHMGAVCVQFSASKGTLPENQLELTKFKVGDRVEIKSSRQSGIVVHALKHTGQETLYQVFLFGQDRSRKFFSRALIFGDN